MPMAKTQKSRTAAWLYRVAVVLPYIILLGLVVILCRELQRRPKATAAGAAYRTDHAVAEESVMIPAEHEGMPVEVPATVVWPQDVSHPPLVLLCHGFTGNRAGDGHFGTVAQQLAARGIASIAVDFAGNGESSDSFDHYTLTTMEADLKAALAYMESAHQVDSNNLGMVGHSMGGRVVSLNLWDTVQAAALWSPANNDGLDGLEFLARTPEERSALQQTAQEQGTVELPQWQVSVSGRFMDQMALSNPNEQLAKFEGRLLVAFAAGDAEILSEETIRETLLAAKQADKDFVNLYGLFEDATHNYTALSRQEQEDTRIRQRIETETVRFLSEALLEGPQEQEECDAV